MLLEQQYIRKLAKCSHGIRSILRFWLFILISSAILLFKMEYPFLNLCTSPNALIDKQFEGTGVHRSELTILKNT